MPANQKYSGRIHTKRQLGRAVDHIQATVLVLSEVGERYQEVRPIISECCKHMLEMMAITENLLTDMKDNL